MKRMIFFLIVVFCQLSVAQEPTVRSRNYLHKKFRTGEYPTQTDFYDWMESYVHKTEDPDMLGGDTPFDGSRQITTEGFPSLTPGGQTVTEFLNNLFYAARKPTVGVSMSPNVFEKMATGAEMSVTVNYTIGRPVGCPAITTVSVDGSPATVPAVAEGSSGTGSATRTIVRNVNKSFSVSVAAGSQTANASANTTWSYARYWGALDKNTDITDADILALSGAGVGTGKELNETRVKAYNGINGGGKYLVFVFLSTSGAPTFFINGLNSTAFTKARDGAFTNALGATYNVQVWVSNTKYNSPVTQFEIK